MGCAVYDAAAQSCVLPALLHWQVPGIRARFLALTVHNNINPLNEWSAAPQDI
jgi:hypothetical protein